MPLAEPLRARRAADGWRVALVDVQDVYDELSCGDRSPLAIREYLRAIRAAGQGGGRYALLIGGASFDPRDHLTLGGHDFIPTPLRETTTIETASDDWYGDLDGDDVPEIAIGCLPAASAEDARVQIAKLVGYRGRPGDPGWQRQALLIAGHPDGWNFAAASDAIRGVLPPGMEPSAFYAVGDSRPSAPTAPAPELLARLRAGAGLVNFAGHGSVTEWAGTLTAAQAHDLDNGDRLPVVAAMTCLSGLFQDPRQPSLGQALLSAPGGGAIAVWASSASPDARQQATANEAFVRALATSSLGAAVQAAKRAVTDRDLRRSFVLLGDPTLFGAPSPAPPSGAGPPSAPGGPAPVGSNGCAVAGPGSPGASLALLVTALGALRRSFRRWAGRATVNP